MTEHTSSKVLVEHISFGYQNHMVLKDIFFHAEGQESIGLVGANGVGKSTLLKLLVGLLMPAEGHIELNGLSMEKKNLPEIRAHVGYVFQDSDSQLFSSTVYEDVAFAPRNYGYGRKEAEERTIAALEKVQILHLKDKPVYQLSGGEKKLASIATILSMTPDIILMDEPSIALDPRNRRNLIKILNELPQLKIIASHDLDMVLDTCERTILMKDGEIAADGATEAILTDQKLLEECGLELPLRLQG